MIYVCRYRNMTDLAISWERLPALLLSLGVDERSCDEMMSHVYNNGSKSGESAILRRRLRQRLGARALLHYALKREFGLSFAELGWAVRKDGKPYSIRYPEIKFNISHCDCACACAVGLSDVGIDIEKKFAYRESLAKKVCHDAEWAVLKGMDEEMRARQLRYLWSLKESFVKWNGRGLAYGMDRISFAEALPIEPDDEGKRKIGQTTLSYLAYDGGAYTLCACAKEFDFTVNLIDTGE